MPPFQFRRPGYLPLGIPCAKAKHTMKSAPAVRGFLRPSLFALLSACLGCAQPMGVVVEPERGANQPPRTERAHLTLQPSAWRAWLEIDAGAFAANIRTLQTKLSPPTALCAVLKADAYGHGVALLAPTLIASQVEWVAIASNEEARVLRTAGYRHHIMRIRIPLAEEVEQGIPFDLEEMVGNLEQARRLSVIARRNARTLPVHLALNSCGMSRHGIEMSTDQGKQDTLEIAKLPGLKIVGIMAHFPVEEVKDIERGLAAFKAESTWIIATAKLKRSELSLHCANSYAAHVVPDSRLDLVRCGSALYGDSAAFSPEYRPAMVFKSRVAVLQRYPTGNTVSYDRTFVLRRDSILANIPVGYADGYRRAFSGKSHVLIRGRRCPVLGRVTMNSIVADVTDHPEIQAGDEVVLCGAQASQEITRAELEAASGTLWVDLAASWGASNPRILKE
jgi:alanine racemase